MKRRTALVAALLLLVAAATAVAAVGHAKVQVTTTPLGKVLVDTRGHTLYLFEADKGGRSSCYGQCAALWPPYLTASKPAAGPGAKKPLLGTTKRKDGKLQVTYNHHPLYFFASDKKAGQTTGEGIDHFGGEWYVVSAAGKKIEGTSSSSPGSTTPAPPPDPGYGP